jgi:hypothetical protein
VDKVLHHMTPAHSSCKGWQISGHKDSLIAGFKCFVAPSSPLLRVCMDGLAARAEAGSPNVTAVVVQQLMKRQYDTD